MAILRCKMCGGDLEINDNKTTALCESCGTTQTLPKIDDEQRAATFNRGNHFRRTGEFDKALAIYERIVTEDNTDAEAHWCCALCRFGIEYVQDPVTKEYMPTCHRASFDSFLKDVDYLAALEYSDAVTREQYKRDGERIAEVQKGILATSQNEEPFDVFICYKESDEKGERTRDSMLAQDIYYQLTEQGRRVFFARITLEEKVGSQYEPYIFAALNSAKVMVVVGTKAEYLNAVWVKNEWSRYLALMKKDRSKLLLPCYRDMDPYDMPEGLSVLQSYDMSKIGFIQDLIRGVNKVLGTDKKEEKAQPQQVVQSGANTGPLLKRIFMFLEDGDFASASQYCEKVLDIEPENGQVYLYKTCVKLKITSEEKLKNFEYEVYKDNSDFKKALRYLTGSAKEKLESIVSASTELSNEKTKISDIVDSYIKQQQYKMTSKNDEVYKKLETQKSMLAKLESELSVYKDFDLTNEKEELSKLNQQLTNTRKELSECGIFAVKRKKELAQNEQLLQETLSVKEEKIQDYIRKKGQIHQFQNTVAELETEKAAKKAEKAKTFGDMGVISLAVFLQAVQFAKTNNFTDRLNSDWKGYCGIGFGKYNGDKLAWKILKTEGNRALIMTNEVIDCIRYNHNNSYVTWSTCSLRTWLNTDFYNEFSPAEKTAILSVTLDNSESEEEFSNTKNTVDKIFILNEKEAKTYLPSEKERCAQPTFKALKSAGRDIQSWCLRSTKKASNLTTEVSCENGKIWLANSSDQRYGIRPAMWIELNDTYDYSLPYLLGDVSFSDNNDFHNNFDNGLFTVMLASYHENYKIKLIGAIREGINVSLGEAKDIVVNAPSMVISGVSYEKAEILQKQIAEAGGTAIVKSAGRG